jgi:hypothetical protein
VPIVIKNQRFQIQPFSEDGSCAELTICGFGTLQGKARQGMANIFNVLILYKENFRVGDSIIKNK